MREITDIVIHCAATKPDADIGAADIRRWHLKQGWKDIGYHYVIRRDGTVEAGRPLEQAGAHVAGHNARSVGLCLAGGVDDKGRAENNYTPAQWEALSALVTRLRKRWPRARVQGHRDFPGVKKDCPCFDVKTWLEEMESA